VPDPVVRTELAYQRIQQAKRRASQHLSAGDRSAALVDLDAAAQLVRSILKSGVPERLADELAQEADELRYLILGTLDGEYSSTAKYSSMSSSYKSRQRGRDMNRTGQAWHEDQ
jgi:Ca-activated chloride channel family protein